MQLFRWKFWWSPGSTTLDDLNVALAKRKVHEIQRTKGKATHIPIQKTFIPSISILFIFISIRYIYICVWNAIMYAFACFTLLHSIEIKDGKNIDIFRMSTIYSIPSFAAWWLNSCIMLHPLRVSMTTWGMWPGFATSWARRSPCEAAEGWDLPTRASQCPIRGPNFPGLGPQAGDVARWTPGGLQVDSGWTTSKMYLGARCIKMYYPLVN